MDSEHLVPSEDGIGALDMVERIALDFEESLHGAQTAPPATDANLSEGHRRWSDESTKVEKEC